MATLTAAIAVMLGADVGTSLMAVVFHFDLTWLLPLLIFIGVLLFIARQNTTVGRVGRILIGLGLMLLASSLISASTRVLTQSEVVQLALKSLSSDLLLEVAAGALIACLACSSLATVLLIATLAASQVIPVEVALGLVLGANLGCGLLAVLPPSTRQLPCVKCRWKIYCSKTDNSTLSIETSSLHLDLDLISELKRINSHICSIAYPILDSAGALSPTRLRQGNLRVATEPTNNTTNSGQKVKNALFKKNNLSFCYFIYSDSGK